MPLTVHNIFIESSGMSQPPFEKFINYGNTRAHIRILENPTGLVFIAPGAEVKIDDPLLKAIRDSCEAKGQATVLADLGKTPINMENPYNVHGNFTKALQNVIEGYTADNDFMPNKFELIGHSMGGAAVLTLAKDNPVLQITVLDPVPVGPNILKTVECPTNFILSNVRSFRAAGERMFNDLVQQTDISHSIHKIETSKKREEGHMFIGATSHVAKILLDYGLREHNLTSALELKGLE